MINPKISIEKAIWDGSKDCGVGIIVKFFTKKYLISDNGKLNKLLEKTFTSNPIGVCETLKSYGISNKEIILVTRSFTNKVIVKEILNILSKDEELTKVK